MALCKADGVCSLSQIAQFRPLLKQTQLEKAVLVCCYDANKDGWSTSTFHQKMDGMGAAGMNVLRKLCLVLGCNAAYTHRESSLSTVFECAVNGAIAVVLFETKGGALVGAYNPKGW